MLDLMPASHPFDTGSMPNRQGYLILGPCMCPPAPVLAECRPEPPDPEFGILPCRCLKSRFRIYDVDSDTTPLAPHDLVRVKVVLRNVCSL